MGTPETRRRTSLRARRPSRREFLLAGAGAAALYAHAASPAARSRGQTILVVGAGMAGLGAALELSALGHEVAVLEARTRPGGRVQTMRDPFPDGLYADAGAMQVYDSHARVQKYVRQFGLELDPIASTAPGSIMQVLGRRIDLRAGEPVAWPFPVPDGDKDVDLRGLFGKYVVPHLAAVRDADAKGELLERLGQFDRVSFSDFLRSQGASSAMVAVLNVGLPLGLGDGGDRHSALNLLREAAYRQARKQAFTIRGGTDRLPKALAARLGDRIHYDSPVVRIEQDRSGVRAVAMARGAPRSFTAERLICAMPFAVLRHVAISPALTREKRHAIDQLPNTSVAKVFVQTRSRFWIQAGLSGSAQSDRPPMLISERTINQPGTRGILEAYLAGAEARRVCALPERERIRWVVVELTRLFPALAEQAEGGATKCWDEDDWARGAYAWFQPGQMTSLLPHLAHPEGRIHFAGDHTSSTPGWMEGALQSAERVVGEVAAAS